MKKTLTLAFCAVSAAAFGGNYNFVQNGNFGAVTYTPGYYETIYGPTSSLLPDWTIIGNNVAGIGVGYFGGAFQEVDVSGIVDNDSPPLGIVQTLNTTAGTTYHLTFDLYTGQPGYNGSVTVDVNGTAIAGGTNLQGGYYNSAPNTQAPALESFYFTGTGAPMTLAFMDGSLPAPNGGNVAQIGQVSVTAPAPAAYFAMGLPFLLIFRRRAQK